MPNKRIVVTGADGFIGSHLTETLVKAGHDVRALVQYNSFGSFGWLDHADPDLISEVNIVASDIRDPHAMRDLIKGREIVFHLASLIAIPYSYHAPGSYAQTNLVGTLNVLQAARDCDVERFIHTSTSEVYGTAQYVPIDERHPLNAQSPYAATKIAADQMALSFYRSFEMPVAVMRPFNTFGPRQSARAVIPTIISQLLAGSGSLSLGSLHPTRDFTYVEDMANAFVAFGEAEAALGEVVNFGSGFEISITDVVKLVGDILEIEVRPVLDAVRVRPVASEVDRLWADVSKAGELTNWSPRFSGRDGFRKGLALTIEWFRDPKNLAAYKTDVYNI